MEPTVEIDLSQEGLDFSLETQGGLRTTRSVCQDARPGATRLANPSSPSTSTAK